MKQNLHEVQWLDIGMDIDLIEEMKFIAVQGEKEINWTYPSERVLRLGDRVLGLVWTKDETWLFKKNDLFTLDSEIVLKDSPYQPETNKLMIMMDSTMFKRMV